MHPQHNDQHTPLLTHQRRPTAYASISLKLGILGGLAWFFLNISLPDHFRGLTCCDASIFLRLSEGGLGSVFFLSSSRVFGYPFYLAIFRALFDNHPIFLPTALITQLVIHFLSSTFLVYALRMAGVRVPPIALALLFAHPAFAGIAAMSLSDSLATSFISLVFGAVILITNKQGHLKTKSIILGLLSGATLTIRPQLTLFILLSAGIVAISLFWISYKSTHRLSLAFRGAVLSIALYLVGFVPVYAHLINNCYSKEGRLCVLTGTTFKGAVAESFNYVLSYSRLWGTVSPAGFAGWRQNEDRILTHCSIPETGAVQALLSCYKQNLTRLPRHFFRRTLGIFDNRYTNPHTGTGTSDLEFWTIRTFSAVGLIGLVTTLSLLVMHLGQRALAPNSYLLLPLIYLGIQINFHPETRYIFPIVPLLFLLGISAITTNPFTKRWQYATSLIFSCLLLTTFFLTVSEWDADCLARFHSR